MNLRRAHILFKDRIAGLVEETPQGSTVFTYQDGWSETIACALPIEERRVAWLRGLHPVFQNLGPEGWLRQQQARAGRVDEEDDFGLLLRYGIDCIGAISVRSEEEVERAPAVQFGDEVANAAVGARRTVSGVQRKLLVWHDGDCFQPATDDSPATYIAKYAPEAQPDLLRNELYSLGLASEVLGPEEVTRFQTGPVEGILGHALLVERFDRAPDGAKLRLEDFAQVLARPRGNDFRGKYEGSYEEIAEGIARHSARPKIDLARFFSALVFNLLIGNADAHLKNWSLLERPEGLRLSPQYDLLNTLLYGGTYDTRTALAICGDKVPVDGVDRQFVLRFGERIGLPPRAAALRLDELRRKLSRSRRLEPPLAEPADGFVNRYSDVVRNACARILEQ